MTLILDNYRTDIKWDNPIRGPQFVWGNVEFLVVHYTGAANVIDGDPGENWDDIPKYLNNLQNYYIRERGFSIGYNVMSDQRGVTWELRGDTFRCAANIEVNHRAFATLVLVDGQESATPANAAAIRRLMAQAKMRAPKARIVTHASVAKNSTNTACPGIGLTWQVEHGKFEPTPEDYAQAGKEAGMDIVFWKDARYHDVFQVYPSVAPVSSEYHKWATAANVLDTVTITDRHRTTLKSLAVMTGKETVTRGDWSQQSVASLPNTPD